MTARPRADNAPAADHTETVRVDLGERGYAIRIGPGLIDTAGAEISERLPGARALIVSDTNVAPLHGERLSISLRAAGIDHRMHKVPAGEASKRFEQLEAVVDAILSARLERGDAVIALGGGVVGDLAGFAAAIARRGMAFVQTPTSLLAQVDSSVGGKTGINTRHGKNLVGAFHQPALVVADTALLETLTPRDFASGYAELVKHGMIARPDFFAWLEDTWPAVFAGGPERAQAVAESCRIKAAVVADDEREHGNRALLNLGHTFGHALEAAAGFDPERLTHGEGVAIGAALAHRFSVALGLCRQADSDRVEAHLKAVGLPTHIAAMPGERPTRDALMESIAQDKKVQRGRLTFILTRGIGRAFVERNVDPDRVSAFLDTELSA